MKPALTIKTEPAIPDFCQACDVTDNLFWNWLRNRHTVEILCILEQLQICGFDRNPVEIDGSKCWRNILAYLGAKHTGLLQNKPHL